MAPGFSTQFCDVEVDFETPQGNEPALCRRPGRRLRDPPSYVEGQIQGGVVQGIDWALNGEYIYDKNGRLDNAGFLDCRVPASSDLRMIDAVLVEVPNPGHPFGVKGVGEVNIVPLMPAIANAIDHAIGHRLTELPMSPPKIVAAPPPARPTIRATQDPGRRPSPTSPSGLVPPLPRCARGAQRRPLRGPSLQCGRGCRARRGG
jgi:CO/xanthine dehydrogenase Mo-binding subunit